jgi:hypothetical protein
MPNIDKKFLDDLEKAKEIYFLIGKALFQDVGKLPDDLDSCDTQDDVDQTKIWSDFVYSKTCELLDQADEMLIGDQVQRKYSEQQWDKIPVEIKTWYNNGE